MNRRHQKIAAACFCIYFDFPFILKRLEYHTALAILAFWLRHHESCNNLTTAVSRRAILWQVSSYYQCHKVTNHERPYRTEWIIEAGLRQIIYWEHQKCGWPRHSSLPWVSPTTVGNWWQLLVTRYWQDVRHVILGVINPFGWCG